MKKLQNGFLRIVLCVTFIVCFSALRLSGDVFSLWPFSGKGNLSANNLSVLEGVELWQEAIRINGRNLDLNITLIERPLDEILPGLRQQYKNFTSLAGNSNSLLFEVPLKNGERKRFYLAAVNGLQSMLLFSMVLPKKFDAKNKRAIWPNELILPPGAIPGTVMSFPKRGSLYGQFHSYSPVQEVISQMKMQAHSRRWKSVADDDNRFASGGLYLRGDKAKEIMIFSVKGYEPSTGKRGCSGTVYIRKLESVSSHF